MIQLAAFYMFTAIMLFSAGAVILSRNPVHSVLWLILAFFNAAGLMLLVGAEFIAMLLVIVYVGAVMVLFLFVVMMLNIDFAEMRGGLARYGIPGALVAAVLAIEVGVADASWHSGALQLDSRTAIAPEAAQMPNIQAVGAELYTHYLYIFEGAGLVLLVAMIGAIVLTLRPAKGVRAQNVGRQVRRRPQDATQNMHPQVGAGVEL